MGKSRFAFIFFPAALLILAALCSNSITKLIAEVDGREDVNELQDVSYSYDSTAILDFISTGNPDIFTLQIETPNTTLSPNSGPVTWTQTDYLEIANAFYRDVLKEDLAEWNFSEFTFLTQCRDASAGPQIARFHLFKAVEEAQEESSRLERFIYIEPQNNQLSLVETEYQPNIHVPSNLNISNIHNPVEAAMQVAENNGGQAFRRRANDICNISALRLEDEWLIQYIAEGAAFKIKIDDQNGTPVIVQ